MPDIDDFVVDGIGKDGVVTEGGGGGGVRVNLLNSILV